METLELKIGRHTYTITNKDKFMDNGSCVQLLTQSKEPASFGFRPNPILSKRAIKKLLSIPHTKRTGMEYVMVTIIQIK